GCGLVTARLAAARGPSGRFGGVEEQHTGMFDLYAANRHSGIPNYITEDFLLLAFSVVASEEITAMEETQCFPEFRKLVGRLSEKVRRDGDRGIDGQIVARFVNIVELLVNGKDTQKLGPGLPQRVAAEVGRIRAAEGFAKTGL